MAFTPGHLHMQTSCGASILKSGLENTFCRSRAKYSKFGELIAWREVIVKNVEHDMLNVPVSFCATCSINDGWNFLVHEVLKVQHTLHMALF